MVCHVSAPGPFLLTLTTVNVETLTTVNVDIDTEYYTKQETSTLKDMFDRLYSMNRRLSMLYSLVNVAVSLVTCPELRLR